MERATIFKYKRNITSNRRSEQYMMHVCMAGSAMKRKKNVNDGDEYEEEEKKSRPIKKAF